jgi:hypothetical protein
MIHRPQKFARRDAWPDKPWVDEHPPMFSTKFEAFIWGLIWGIAAAVALLPWVPW